MLLCDYIHCFFDNVSKLIICISNLSWTPWIHVHFFISSHFRLDRITNVPLSTAESYRKSFIATSGGQSLRAHKLFCSWDFGISNQESADLKHQNVYHELKSILNELYENVCFQTILQRICAYVISTLIWIFILVVLIVIGSSIIFVTEISEVSCLLNDAKFAITFKFFSFLSIQSS